VRRVRVGRGVQPLHPECWSAHSVSSFESSRLCFIDTTDEVTDLFGPDADLAVAVQRITREAGVYTRDGHSDYGHAFVSFLNDFPNVLSPRSSLLVLGDGRNNYRNPRPTCSRTW